MAAVFLLPTLSSAPRAAGTERRIAFVSYEGLYLLSPSEGGTRRVVRQGPYEANNYTTAAWSPDRTRIVFTAGRHSASDVFVWTVGSDDPIRITKTENRAESSPTWSPDGNSVAFIGQGEPPQVYVARADGGGSAAQLTKDRAHKTDVEWSPGGRTLAVETSNGIRLMAADGSSSRMLTRNGRDSEMTWAPNGSRLAFVRRNDGGSDIWVLDVAGGEAARATNGPGRDLEPEWSPDGSLIAYTRSVDSGRRAFIEVVEPDGEERRRLTDSIVKGDQIWFFPTWSPSSRRIAFRVYGRAGTRRSPWDIWVVDRTGKKEHNLTGDSTLPVPYGLDW